MASEDSGARALDAGDTFSSQLELLADMGRDFATSLDIEKTLQRAIEHITMYLDAASGALFLLEDQGATLRCHVCTGETEITGVTLPADQGIVGRCVQSNTAEVIRDAAEDPSFYTGVDKVTGFTTRSILCAPLSVKDQKIGAIELINRKSGDGLFRVSDLTMLDALCSSAALAILNARMAESLVEQERVRREVELAAEIQRTLLPAPRPAPFPVHGVNVPARMVSGDFYDFFPLDDGRICFNLGDVSGKGMNAAMLMAKTASLYRCLGKTLHQPGHLLSVINDEICETVTRGMFVTMVCGIYDPGCGLAVLANAGHEPPLHLARDGTFTSFPAEAPPLGISTLLTGSDSFPETEVRLGGGALYLFTDGGTEGYLENGQPLEVEGLKSLLLETAAGGPAAVVEAVAWRFGEAEGTLRDDLTMLAIDDRAAEEKRMPPMTAESTAAEGAGETLLSLSLPARADRLKLVRGAVAEAVRACGCDADTAQGIVIAVDEACQNVIRHAYGGTGDGRIDVEIRRGGNSVSVLVRDFAETVDAAAIQPRDLDDLRPGGLGTHFIRELMDEVEFGAPPEGQGNLLRMTKRIA
jgi:sigma-B regulation protein RsbU (phosphoserine phosphatase)